MQDSAGLDELDLAIVHALQIAPRASWRLTGEVLGVDAVTVARRWQRLQDTGLAWVTCVVTDTSAAVVEVDCVPGSSGALANRLAADPRTLSVRHVAGGASLTLLVAAADLQALSAYLLDRLQTLDGVRAARSHIVTKLTAEGGDWRLRSLSRAQQRAMAAGAPAPSVPVSAAALLTALDRRIAQALAADGRMPLTDIAQHAGVSVTTARRRMSALLDSRRLALRCDISLPDSGWPITVTFWGQAPADQAETTARALAAIPEVRMCLNTAGPHNIVLDVWLRALSEITSFESRLVRILPHFRIADRNVVLRTVKRIGRLIDERGRAVGTVPMS
ncbi:Lrp/AsnC family transcriptional regulator [Streptomyces sp. NPDC005897]|uniref:Lrp/AsnC family transcriptional regulator n=1 Tax=Streptomyces sp. NPDC005897 TaxID=3157081 RepID=UPI003401BD9C